MYIYEKQFYLPKKKLNSKWLENNNFRWSKIHSDSESDVYIYRFIAWRYGTAGVLEGEIMVDCKDGSIRLGCYDYGTRYCYASWYCREYGTSTVVEEIDKKMLKELERLGIKEKNNDK